ncbi:MAG: peptidase M23 [Porticoccaceae bacterium]|nr:peptidase M23 [Porticoccaceae bacterium]
MDGFDVPSEDMDLEKRFRSPLLLFAEELISTIQSWPLKIVFGFAAAFCLILILIGHLIAVEDNQHARRQVVEQLEIHFDKVRDSNGVIASNSDGAANLKKMLVWRSEKVKNGDNLSALFERAGVPTSQIYDLTASPGGDLLNNLSPGEQFHMGLGSNETLIELQYVKSPLLRYVFENDAGYFQVEKRTHTADVLYGYRNGIIKDSLYNSAKRAQLPDNIIMEMANLFGWDIDFVFDIRAGDKFSVLFEDRFLHGERLNAGDIIAASFTNRGNTYRAVRYEHRDGSTQYYSPEGLSMRKTFLRTPLDIFRITSGFNLRRKHPIHKKIKAHRGVDYAAPRGTPVYAAGKGKVVESSFSKPNGNFVFIQHGQTYMTKYLHLDQRKVEVGQSISQGKVIGTVGSTGYSTGPHLHYEFLVNGVHQNPRTVELPKANPIDDSERERFDKISKALLVRLEIRGQASQNED